MNISKHKNPIKGNSPKLATKHTKIQYLRALKSISSADSQEKGQRIHSQKYIDNHSRTGQFFNEPSGSYKKEKQRPPTEVQAKFFQLRNQSSNSQQQTIKVYRQCNTLKQLISIRRIGGSSLNPSFADEEVSRLKESDIKISCSELKRAEENNKIRYSTHKTISEHIAKAPSMCSEKEQQIHLAESYNLYCTKTATEFPLYQTMDFEKNNQKQRKRQESPNNFFYPKNSHRISFKPKFTDKRAKKKLFDQQDDENDREIFNGNSFSSNRIRPMNRKLQAEYRAANLCGTLNIHNIQILDKTQKQARIKETCNDPGRIRKRQAESLHQRSKERNCISKKVSKRQISIQPWNQHRDSPSFCGRDEPSLSDLNDQFSILL